MITASLKFLAAESRWQPDTLPTENSQIPFPLELVQRKWDMISICCRLEIAQLTGYILGSRGQRKVGQKLRPASPRFRFMFWACYQSISSAWFQKWGRCHAHGDLATSLLSSPSPCCSRLHLLVCASSSFFLLEVLEFVFHDSSLESVNIWLLSTQCPVLPRSKTSSFQLVRPSLY